MNNDVIPPHCKKLLQDASLRLGHLMQGQPKALKRQCAARTEAHYTAMLHTAVQGNAKHTAVAGEAWEKAVRQALQQAQEATAPEEAPQ